MQARAAVRSNTAPFERGQQRKASVVRLGRRPAQLAADVRTGDHLSDDLLQQAADPARRHSLASLDAGDRLVIAGDEGQADVRAEQPRHRPDHGPASLSASQRRGALFDLPAVRVLGQ